MDKATSIVAALEAGKLPSTQQVNQFIDWLDKVGITSVEPSSTDNLSSHGRLLANRVRDVLDAYKQLGMNKNGDNIVQEAIWHLSEGDLTNTTTTTRTGSIDKDKATADINAIRSSLRSLLSVFWTSLSSESTSLLHDFASFTRLSLADAAELIEASAGTAKEGLREIEKGVEKGERTNITGRNKERVEAEEGDVKVQWEHGMDAVKGAGDSVIDAGREVGSSAQDKIDRTSSRVQDAYLKICDRAQSDPAYRDSISTIFSIIQKRLNQSLDSAASVSPQNLSLSSFINDPTPEQHVPKALHIFQTLIERLSSMPLDSVMDKARICVICIGNDPDLRQWFDEFFDLSRKNLTEQGYVRSEESKNKRKDLRIRWKTLLEKDGNWKKAIDELKTELAKFQEGLSNDKDLNRLKDAHNKLGADIESGLVEAGDKAETGLDALMERATWFWQDIFKVYLPRVVGFFGDLPIPRTEYKDSEIEFVLENLDVSSLNLLPSHVYIRNITDVDINTSSSSSQTSIGTLTRIKIEALQLTLKDVSFWYKDLQATALTPSEFTGLLGLTLPAQGVAVDIKVRLIPRTVTGSGSRHQLNHFHVVEYVKVEISEDVKMDVKESNHGILFSMFKPIFLMRFREALEKTLAGQIRAAIEWADGVAWDVGKRREVFEDTGLGGGASVFAALWSEIGRFKRERMERGDAEVGWRATGTGVVVEQRQPGGGSADVKFAMGAEPQILSGEKRGPLGTASEPLGKRAGDVVKDATGMDIDVSAEDVQKAGQKATAQVKEAGEQVKRQAQGFVQESRKQVQTFKETVDVKKEKELKSDGWRSVSFDV